MFRYFRVVPANDFLLEFASDRRHMKRQDGSWIKTPPTYPAITTQSKQSHWDILSAHLTVSFQKIPTIWTTTYKWTQQRDRARSTVWSSSYIDSSNKRHRRSSHMHDLVRLFSQFFIVLLNVDRTKSQKKIIQKKKIESVSANDSLCLVINDCFDFNSLLYRYLCTFLIFTVIQLYTIGPCSPPSAVTIKKYIFRNKLIWEHFLILKFLYPVLGDYLG